MIREMRMASWLTEAERELAEVRGVGGQAGNAALARPPPVVVGYATESRAVHAW